MWLAGHRALQLGVFIAMLITVIQLSFDRVDLFRLIRNAVALVVNEYGLSLVSR